MLPTTASEINLIDIDVDDIKAQWPSLCGCYVSCTIMWGVCGLLCALMHLEVDT